MIILYHTINKVTSVRDTLNACDVEFDRGYSVTQILFSMAKTYPDRLIVWAHQKIEKLIAFEHFETIFHHDAIIASYSTSQKFSIPDTIGYVEQSPFIKIKAEVRYPTWIMSSTIGGAKGKLLQKFVYLEVYNTFPLMLNHMSKDAQQLGVLCYADPRLLKAQSVNVKEPTVHIFRFVKQHYKTRWLYLLVFNLIVYENKWPLIAFLKGMFYRKYKKPSIELSDIQIESTRSLPKFSLDVVIPTIGRKVYLKKVLLDISKQTLLPKKVIIIEQAHAGISELDYIKNEWPFEIVHRCIDQFGACNARNIALKEVTANWVFFADDDIRLAPDTIQNTWTFIKRYGVKAVSISCLQKGEQVKSKSIKQSINFGSGTSIVEYNALQGLSFKKEHEFGYGEDVDFGMQLRNKGIDVLYNPQIEMLHLKAPIGGFRVKIETPWHRDRIQPKPSPMVMAFKLKHYSKKQLLGYKTTLFLKFYKRQQIKNPLKYILRMRKQWQTSITWANKRISESNE